MRILFLLLLMLVYTNSFSQKSFSKQKLFEDFDYAVKELKSQHQGIYQYVDQEKVDSEISSLRAEIKPTMSRLEFYQLMRKLIALANEGHGSVKLPKRTRTKMGLSKSFFPLTLKFFDKELVVVQNYGDEVAGLSKGMKVLSINGESVEAISNKLFPLIATDGFNETVLHEWVAGVNLCLLYRLVYGAAREFTVEVIAANATESKTLVLPAIRYTTFKSKNAKFQPKYFNYKKFFFAAINDSIAYLSIPTFGSGPIDYPSYFAKQFKKIDSLKIKHLILDIQANGGGTEGNENLLFSYLAKDKVQKYKKVTMLPKPYDKNKKDKDYLFDKWELKGTMAERGAFTLYSDYYSDLGYAPPQEKYIYDQQVYVLISGYTFSGGAEFASLLKMTERALFIGEETGGAYEGNVSGYSESIKLPNTKIKIKIPTVHFQINVNPALRGRGVLPDHRIPQTWEDYLDTQNSKLEFAKDLIRNQNDLR